jgi:outer membrane protein
MKVKYVVFLAILTLAVGYAPAQDQQPFRLTLDEARNYALQHNKSLMNAKDNVTSSHEKLKEIRSQGLPQVEGSMNFMTYFNYELDFSFGSTSQPDIDYTKLDEGDFEVMDAIGQMFSSEPIVMNNQLSGKVQLSQLIFSGQYWAGMQTARIAGDLMNQNLTRGEQEVKEGVTNTYYLILITEQNLRIIQENIENLNAILQHTDNMYKTGIAEESDVDQLKIARSQLENSQKMVERAIQLNYNLLRFQLGVAPDAKLNLSDSIDAVLAKIHPESALMTDFDITQNINYQMTESQVKLSEKQVDMQNWAYAPVLAGFYSYTQKIITTGFDLTPKHVAGFNLTVPIFSSGMRRAKVSQAKIDHDIAMRNQEMVKDQLETQEKQVVFNYQNALANFSTQKENVTIAGRLYNKIQNKFRQGMVSSLDLTQANSNYLNAENNYLSSVMTLLQAQTALDKLYNRL